VCHELVKRFFGFPLVSLSYWIDGPKLRKETNVLTIVGLVGYKSHSYQCFVVQFFQNFVVQKYQSFVVHFFLVVKSQLSNRLHHGKHGTKLK